MTHHETLSGVRIGSKTFRPGEVVRFTAGKRTGPIWTAGGVSGLYTLPGWFKIVGVFRTRSRSNAGWRTYLDVLGLDKTGGSFTVFVVGGNYNAAGVRWRPYRVLPKPTRRARKGKRKQ